MLVYQSTYIKKNLKSFHKCNAHYLISLMVIRSLRLKMILSPPLKMVKNYIGSWNTSSKCYWCTFIYILSIVQFKTLFFLFFIFINLIAKDTPTPTQRHWNDIKYILCYLHRTLIWVFYSKKKKVEVMIAWICKCNISFIPT